MKKKVNRLRVIVVNYQNLVYVSILLDVYNHYIGMSLSIYNHFKIAFSINKDGYQIIRSWVLSNL